MWIYSLIKPKISCGYNCTRPLDNCASYFVVNALVAFKPTYQSASERATAASYNVSYFFPGCNFLKPSRIALSVTEEIQRRLTRFLKQARVKKRVSRLWISSVFETVSNSFISNRRNPKTANTLFHTCLL